MLIIASIIGSRILAPLSQLVTQWRAVVTARDAYRRVAQTIADQDDTPPGMPLPAPKGVLTVEALTAGLRAALPLDEFRVCDHDDPDECACRKPRPGLLLEAARAAGLDLAASFMVGDRWRDIAAGQQAGCQCLFVDYQYPERQPALPFIRVRSLAEAAEWILSHPSDAREASVSPSS